jgi:hypothetical protein
MPIPAELAQIKFDLVRLEKVEKAVDHTRLDCPYSSIHCILNS